MSTRELKIIRRRRLTVVETLAIWAAFAAVAALDRSCHVTAQQANVFSVIWVGIKFVADALGVIGPAIASSLEAVVGYLIDVVAFLGRRLAHIVLSTGTIFARTWEGLRTIWNRVLRPALAWIDTKVRALERWLQKTFEPVFRFLRRVRDELDALYRRFVAPVLDTIEFLRHANAVLETFHIHLLSKLDDVLAQLEEKIERPFLFVYGKLNELTNWVNRIVGADGLFQRLVLVRSLERDVAYQWRMLFNARNQAVTSTEQIALLHKNRPPTKESIAQDFIEYSTTGGGRMASPLSRALARASSGWPE